MKGKKIAVLSLALSSLLAFTVAGVACKKGGGGTNAGSETAVSLISDSTLTDKFFALYTFEDTGDVLTAINPYTGAIADTFNGSYFNTAGRVTNPKKQTDASGSQYVLDTDAAVRLGNFSSVIGDEFDDNNMPTGSVQDGLSFSFWAYNNETIVGPVEGSDESADWSNMITNGFESINWGNLTHLEATTNDGGFTNVYPDRADYITVGRGAYTDGADGSYEAIRTSGFSSEDLKVYRESYAVWNAVSGNRQDGSAQIPDNEYIEDVAAAYLNNWRYLTVNIDYTEGLSFYVNGRLAYRYAPDAFEVEAPMREYGGWEAIYADFVLGAIKSGSAYIDMFGAECGITVDDLIVGKSITETDACALYENITGNTWTEDDLKLESAASAIDQEKTAFDEATFESLHEGVQTPVEGDKWGEDAITGYDKDNKPIVAAGVEREDGDDEGTDITDTVYDAREAWLNNTDAWTADGDGYKASDFSEQVGALTYNGGYQPATSKYYKPTLTDGTFNMTVSGVLLASGAQNYHSAYVTPFLGSESLGADIRIDNYVNGGETANVSVTGTNMDITWPDASTNGIYLNVIQRFCKLDIVFAYDGTSLTITYRVYYYFAGESYSTTLSDGTSYTYTVPKDSSTLYNYITYTVTPKTGTTLDYDALALRFGSESSCFLISSVTGGEATDTPPEVNVSDEEQARADAIAAVQADRQAALTDAINTAVGDGQVLETVGDDTLPAYADNSGVTVTPTSGETWSVTVTGFMRSSGENNAYVPGVALYLGSDNFLGVVRADRWFNPGSGSSAFASAVDGGKSAAWSIKINGTEVAGKEGTQPAPSADEWANWASIIAYAKYDITIAFDGANLTITYKAEAVDGGTTYNEQYTWGTDGSGTYTEEISDNAWEISVSISDSSIIDNIADLGIALSQDHCFYSITSVTGGTVSAAA